MIDVEPFMSSIVKYELKSVRWEMKSYELTMNRVATKFVQNILTADQKQQCWRLQGVSIGHLQRCNLIVQGFTGDESWFYGCDLRQATILLIEKSNFTKKKKARQVNSKEKSTFVVSFDIKGIVNKEFVPEGQTVNSTYCDVLWWLRENVRTLATKVITVASQQRFVSRFLPHHGLFERK